MVPTGDVEGYAVVDLEATGKDFTRDQIIEVGIVLTDLEGNIQQKLHTLVRPGTYIPPESTKIHHITEPMVKHAPVVGELQSTLLSLTDSRFLVAHNATLETWFLKPVFAPTLLEQNNFVDTLILSRKFLKLSHNKLVDLAEYYQIETPTLHIAVNDALVTAQVLKHMLEDPKIPHQMLQSIPFYADGYENYTPIFKNWLPRELS